MTDKPYVRLIVMAAGLSRRFGSNKLLRPLGGRPMFSHILELIQAYAGRQANTCEVIVVSAWPEILAASRAAGFKTVMNTESALGLSHTIRLALEAPGAPYDVSVFFTADQPFFTAASLEAFMEQVMAHPDQIVCVRDERRTGNPVSFPSDLKPELMTLTGDAGGKQVMRQHMDRVLPIYVDAAELRDIDDAGDWAAYVGQSDGNRS